MPELEHGYFDISVELMSEIVRGIEAGDTPRRFVVVKDPIPSGAVVRHIDVVGGNVVRVIMDGCEPRQYTPQLKTCNDADVG